MKELDGKILDLYYCLNKLDNEKKGFYHIKSTKNITKYLINNKIKNERLQNFSLIRKKELLLDYLRIIVSEKDKNKGSKYYYDNYVSKLGRFMNSYYGFVYCGGKTIFLFLGIYILIGFFLDVLMFLFFYKIFYITFLFFSVGVTRAIIKHKQKKVYGPNY